MELNWFSPIGLHNGFMILVTLPLLCALTSFVVAMPSSQRAPGEEGEEVGCRSSTIGEEVGFL